MSYFQAFFLAVVQGLTEFLPISSSGHLVIFQKLFGLKPPILFDILVHVGTLGAIIFYFKRELLQILDGLVKGQRKSWATIWLIFVGTIPAVVVGLFLQAIIELIFDSLRLVGLSLLVTAGLLFSTKWVKKPRKEFKDLKWSDAFLVGLFQALAILPGISRSGSTIVSGLWRRLDQKVAFRFSFFLAIPAIIGALILQMPNLLLSSCSYLGQGLLGMVVAGMVGYLALVILEKVLKEARLFFFGFYCFLMGIFILLA
jgi:undecaprenyl-diphosphatase